MKKKILIAEDEAIVAKSIKLFLEGRGYDIFSTVSTGEDAVRSAEKNKPDLVIMDVRLRGSMDGYEAVAKIRLSAKVPVIYSTAGDQYQINEDAKGTKPYDYIIKPFDHEVLAYKIEKMLDEHCDGLKEEKGTKSEV